MKILFRVLASLLMMLALLLLVNCSGAPGCPQASFGTSTACGPGGNGSFGNGGGGGGSGGGATPAAFVYAVDQVGGTSGTGANGTIDGYDLSTSAVTFAALTNYTAPQIPADDPGVAMVIVNKTYLYAIFQQTQKIYGYSIDSSSGALTLLNGFPLVAPAFDITNVSYNQYNVTTDPGGNFLFVSATNAVPAGIYVYSISSSTGALAQVTGSPFLTPSNFAPGNITTDGLGKYLYVCENAFEHDGGEILAYSINSTTGFLTSITGSPFTFSTIPGMWQLAGDASGRYLVGTSGEASVLLGTIDPNLYVFSIQQSGTTPGAITQASGSPVATKAGFSPFTIAMQPPSSNGEFVYSFSLDGSAPAYNAIEGFSLNPNSGALTELANSPFTGIPGSPWGQFDQSGNNLVVYSNDDSIFELNFVSGSQTELIPLSVDSSGNLTQPISAATIVTEGWWAITDP